MLCPRATGRREPISEAVVGWRGRVYTRLRGLAHRAPPVWLMVAAASALSGVVALAVSAVKASDNASTHFINVTNDKFRERSRTAMTRPVTDNEASQMRDLRRRGWSLPQIGRRLGRAPTVVQHHTDPEARERMRVGRAVYQARRRRKQRQAQGHD